MKTKDYAVIKSEKAQKWKLIARINLLLVVIFTLINFVLLLTNIKTMILFSSVIPYIAIAFGKLIFSTVYGIALFLIAFALVVAYFLCYLLSKRHSAWMIVALILFAIDSLVFAFSNITFGDLYGILDLLIHGWVLYSLIVSVIRSSQLK